MFEGEGLMSQYLRGFIRLAALAAVGAGCLMVAACGPGNSGGAAATASASGNPDPLASLSASDIATKGIANLEAASSLTMDGSLLISGLPVTVTLGIKPGKGCAGSVDMGSKGSAKLIVIGTTMYLNPDDAYWEAGLAKSDAAAAIHLVNGRYIKTTTSGGILARLCDLSHSLGSLKLSETMTKGKPTTLNGIKVLQITEGSDGWLYVSDTAKPELVGMEMPEGSDSSVAAVLTFSPGAPVTLTAPPASDVVEGSAVGSS